MTQKRDGNYVPRAPRFKVADSTDIAVTITRTEESDHEPLPAELVDVSQHGAKLRVPVNLRFEEALLLRIEVLGKDLEYQGLGSVRHIRAVDDEHWLVGCAIAPPLSDETFSFLATTAGKERRQFRRQTVSAEALVRRQTQAEGIAASLHNLSSGGICFSSASCYELGERVQLTVDGTDGQPRTIEARVCWQVGSPDGSIVGCQFSSRDSYAELAPCLIEQPVHEWPVGHGEQPTSKLVLTAAVLAMFVPPMMTLMLQASKVSAEASSVPSFVSDDEQPINLVADAVEQPSESAPLATDLPAVASVEIPPLAVVEVVETPDRTPEVEVAAEPAIESQPQFREWVDNTGRHRTTATLISANDEHVILQKPNGGVSRVPWRRLSEADQQFAREWQAQSQEGSRRKNDPIAAPSPIPFP